MTKKEPKSSEKPKVKKSTPKSKKGADSKRKLNDLQDQILTLTKENETLLKESSEAKDQSLRSLAELENVKRRKEQEKVDAIKFANERLILDLLPIMDSFELAMGQTNAEQTDDAKAVITGFEMIKKQIEQFLEKNGVVRIEALDLPFDPNLHQGISQESQHWFDYQRLLKTPDF